MIYSQTFSTDLLHKLKQEDVDYMLHLHFLSALSISKHLKAGDEFILITDTKGKALIKDRFPYTSISTALDDYPYVRPLKMSAYKLYAIEVFEGKDFVHFDNDVILFKPIPDFNDTLVQSNEGDFIHTVFINKVQYYNWIFPSFVDKFKRNYNPGVFGFRANSKIRKLYLKTFLEYSHKNIALVQHMESSIDKDLYLREMQDVYLFLEEGLLWYLCNEYHIDVLELIPNKYDNHKNVWGIFKKGKYRGVNWNIPFKVCYMNWKKQQYVHLMNYNHIRNNWRTSFLPQEVFLELYYRNKQEVTAFLNS